jgi:hypothetical protein
MILLALRIPHSAGKSATSVVEAAAGNKASRALPSQERRNSAGRGWRDVKATGEMPSSSRLSWRIDKSYHLTGRESVMSEELELAYQYWKTAAELRLEFIEKLGVFKLDAARSDLVRAVAAGQWALARMKARVALELEAALRRLRRMRTKTHRRIKRLDGHARSAAKIRNAEDIPPGELTRMWAAFTVLERLAPAAAIEQLGATQVQTESRSAENFARPGAPDVDGPSLPTSINNVHGMIGWLKRNRLVPRRGMPAYRQIVAAFSEVAAVARTDVDRMRAALAELEQGTFDRWNPLVIAGLPDTLDVKKIVRAGL